MRKSRVIFLGPVPPPYMGPSLATEILLNSSLRDRFELIHLDTSDRRSLSNLGAVDFTNIYLALKHYVQLVWLIIRHRPRAVYIPISQTTVGYLRDSGFIILAKLFGRKIICHLRGANFRNWFDSTSSMIRFFVRRVHSIVDCQIVLGECLRQLFEGLLPPDRVFVVPNGADYKMPARSDSDGKTTRILFLANLKRSKGVLDVLYAVPLVYNQHRDIIFSFAGSWRDRETRNEFESFLRENSELPVEIIGTVKGEQKDQLFADSDIFVFPSYNEGHPWVVLEAMAASLPVVSTNVGTMSETVRDNENGFILKKGTPSQIAEKVITLLDSPQLRVQMGRESRRLYLENFIEEKMVERMTRAFDSVC